MVLSLASIEQRARSLFFRRVLGKCSHHLDTVRDHSFSSGYHYKWLCTQMEILTGWTITCISESCIALKDFPLRRDFGNKLIKPFWSQIIFRLDTLDADPSHRFYNWHHFIFTACSSICLFHYSSINSSCFLMHFKVNSRQKYTSSWTLQRAYL